MAGDGRRSDAADHRGYSRPRHFHASENCCRSRIGLAHPLEVARIGRQSRCCSEWGNDSGESRHLLADQTRHVVQSACRAKNDAGTRGEDWRRRCKLCRHWCHGGHAELAPSALRSRQRGKAAPRLCLHRSEVRLTTFEMMARAPLRHAQRVAQNWLIPTHHHLSSIM